MSITPEITKRVAALARLEVTDQELAAYTGQLTRILDVVAELQRIPTAGVEPLIHAVATGLPEREDRVVNPDQRESLLAGAPDSHAGCFRVPRVIE